jgi:hypothetical protein
VADHLLSAQTVVLAREHPEQPYRYGSTRVLKGTCQAGEDFKLLLNSSLRQSLLTDPELHVLLAKVGEGEQVEWRPVGTTGNGPFLKVVRDILRHAPTWKNKPSERWGFFAPYLGHQNKQLHKLAYIELARAPFADLKNLRLLDQVPLEDIRVFLADPQYLEWHSLYLLLLAQSDDAKDREMIVRSFHAAEKFGVTSLLRARVTAMIAVQGEAALDLVDAHYLKNRQRNEAEVIAVIHALSDFTDDSSLSARVDQSNALAKRNHPKAWSLAMSRQP